MTTGKTSPGHVPVTVRARGSVPVGWAGRMWPTEPTKLDASPNEVLDLLKAPPHALYVEWPEDYVAPDGSMPGRVSLTAPPKTEQPVQSAADRVARSEQEAARSKSAAMAAERELLESRTLHAAAIHDVETRLNTICIEVSEANKRAAAAEARAVAAVGHAEDIERGHADVLSRLRAEHAGELDTLRAQHAAEFAKLTAEHDVTLTQLTAELDKATAPKKKPPPSGGGASAQPAASVAAPAPAAAPAT